MERLPAVAGLDRTEMASLFEGDALARVRGVQLADWVYKRGAVDFDDMTDLPAAVRTSLAENFRICPGRVVLEQRSTDGVVKLLMDSFDGQAYECVLLPFQERVSCCISTQVGCAMGCEFCATGLSGFDRNLSAGEIVAQVLELQRESVRRISHVVFMGMGEPLLNFEELVKSLRLLNEEVGIGFRHMTVSTVGIVPEIYRLAKEQMPIHLAISLHSPLDDVRSSFMPVNKKWPVSELMQAARDYERDTRRKVTFEYLLIENVTDTPEQAHALAALVKGFPTLVNLIPFNYVDTERGFSRPSNNRVRNFRSILEGAGVNVTQRVERGHDIAAACGQLKGQHEGRFAKRRPRLSELPLTS
ncbi:MAG: 23S rRNA (adenine(2503)-C(2))-methyltransferase RlmN [Armatimonadota bacterium]|nr:23S rRNA (adenine(2503)-C(2))-methyltransferase RlmN [Armatimonadota bacterium]